MNARERCRSRNQIAIELDSFDKSWRCGGFHRAPLIAYRPISISILGMHADEGLHGFYGPGGYGVQLGDNWRSCDVPDPEKGYRHCI